MNRSQEAALALATKAAPNPDGKYDVLSAMISWEQGDLSAAATDELFQRLVNTGLAWRLQGAYGRMAQALIDNGNIRPAR